MSVCVCACVCRGVLRLDYLSALRVLLTQALRKEGEAGIEPTVHLMQVHTHIHTHTHKQTNLFGPHLVLCNGALHRHISQKFVCLHTGVCVYVCMRVCVYT